jgi:hypothetical protein
MRQWRRRKKTLGVFSKYAKRCKSVNISENNNTNKIFLKILTNYTIWDGLSQKTISRYCPFKQLERKLIKVRVSRDYQYWNWPEARGLWLWGRTRGTTCRSFRRLYTSAQDQLASASLHLLPPLPSPERNVPNAFKKAQNHRTADPLMFYADLNPHFSKNLDADTKTKCFVIMRPYYSYQL